MGSVIEYLVLGAYVMIIVLAAMGIGWHYMKDGRQNVTVHCNLPSSQMEVA